MIVVADTSVLLNLCRIGQIELLQTLFRDVLIPIEVATEFSRLARQVERFRGLGLPDWVQQRQSPPIPSALQAANLDPGETAAVALALEIRADALLVDERRGHAVAQQMGIKTVGVLGILLQAKTLGIVPLLRPLLDQLEVDAQFWIGPALRERLLSLAGE